MIVEYFLKFILIILVCFVITINYKRFVEGLEFFLKYLSLFNIMPWPFLPLTIYFLLMIVVIYTILTMKTIL